jgi:preprotein translocase subunit SecE
VAKHDEVEPTDGSDAAEPFNAADEPTADKPGEAKAADELDDLKSADDEPGEGTDHPEDAEPVDEFDEIVRSSGVDHPGEGDSDGDVHGPTDNGAAKLLEPAGVAATTTGSRAGEHGRAPARTPKTAATAKRDQPVKRERTTPLKFVRQSIGELRKVVYPTGQQLINYFIVVLVFVLFVIAYVSLLDLGLGAAIFRIFS